MSSSGVKPTWVPFLSTLSSEEKLPFSLHLMNGRFWVRVSWRPGLTSQVVVLPSDGAGFGTVWVGTQGLLCFTASTPSWLPIQQCLVTSPSR